MLEEKSKISQSDKAMVRENILVFVTQIPPLLRYCIIGSVVFFEVYVKILFFIEVLLAYGVCILDKFYIVDATDYALICCKASLMCHSGI